MYKLASFACGPETCSEVVSTAEIPVLSQLQMSWLLEGREGVREESSRVEVLCPRSSNRAYPHNLEGLETCHQVQHSHFGHDGTEGVEDG